MLNNIQDIITASTKEATQAVAFLETPVAAAFIYDVASLLTKTFQSGHKVIAIGNGGSLCDAAHFAEELTGKFRRSRRPLPAIVLSEAGHMSCVGNDFGFDHIFERGVQAFGQPDDVLLALTTSGNSNNILLALKAAQAASMHRIALLGKGGGAALGTTTHQLIVPHATTSDRIQEAHMACLHIIIEVVEAMLFE